MNLTVRPVTRLAGLLLARDSHGRAQGARPSRPAGYAQRSTDVHMPRFLLLTAIVFMSTGCLAMMQQRVVKGREFPAEYNGQLHIGMSEDEIIAVLGPPYARNARGEQATLRYLEVFQPRICRMYLWWIPLSPSNRITTSLTLIMHQGLLADGWSEVSQAGHVLKRNLFD